MPAFKSPLSSSHINVQKEGLLVDLFQKSFWNKERFFIEEQKRGHDKKVKNSFPTLAQSNTQFFRFFWSKRLLHKKLLVECGLVDEKTRPV